MSAWVIALLFSIAGAAAQDLSTARGTHLTTSGVQKLHLTLSIVQGTASGSAPSYCVVGGLLSPYTYYAGDAAQPGDGYMMMPAEANKADPYALIYASVPLGESAGVTFYGGNVTTQGAQAGAPLPTLYYTVSNSTDNGSAQGPLFITKGDLKTAMADYRLDYAQFFPTTLGQTAWFAGAAGCNEQQYVAQQHGPVGLGEAGAAPACIYNITFTAIAGTMG